VLGGEGAGPPGDEGSDRGAQGNVSLFLVYVKNLSLTDPHRNAGKIAQVKKRPSAKRTPSDRGTPQKKSEDGGGYMVIPYDVGASPPVQTLSPPPKAGGNERPTHKIMQVVGSRTTNESSLRPSPSTGSTFPHLPSSLIQNRSINRQRSACGQFYGWYYD